MCFIYVPVFSLFVFLLVFSYFGPNCSLFVFLCFPNFLKVFADFDSQRMSTAISEMLELLFGRLHFFLCASYFLPNCLET